MNNIKSHDVFVLSASTVDNIIEMEGTFPIEGGCSRFIRNTYPEAGGEGNILICFSRMGGRALPAGPLGNDYFGTFLKKVYEEEGIDTDYLYNIVDYRSPVANCIVADDGTHSFVSSLGYCKFAEDQEVMTILDKCKGFFVSGYFIANRNHGYFDLVIKLIRHAVQNGIEIFFDPGPLAGQIDKEVLDEVLRSSIIVSLNDEEAFSITGIEDVEEAAVRLSAITDALIVVKAGANGCFAISSSRPGKWYPGFDVMLCDTSGAGDSFIGALMYGWIKKWDIDTCLIFANAAGAVKASKLGTGRNVPTFDEMVKILENNGYSIPKECILEKKFIGLHL